MRALCVMLVAFGLAACSTGRQQTAAVAPCDTVTGTATNYGRAQAARYAEADLRRQLPDARGDLVGSGLRRVRVVAKRTACRPYALFSGASGMTTCAAQARVCGR